MRTTTMVWVIIIVLVVLGVGWYFWSANMVNAPTNSTPTLPTPTPPANTGQGTTTSDMPGMPAGMIMSTSSTAQ